MDFVPEKLVLNIVYDQSQSNTHNFYNISKSWPSQCIRVSKCEVTNKCEKTNNKISKCEVSLKNIRLL